MDLAKSVMDNDIRWPVYLHGAPGCGKSALAGLLFMHVQRRPMWINAVDGFKAVVMSAVDPRPLWGYGQPFVEWEHWDELRKRSFVVLDDIGLRGKASDAQYDALQKFLLMRQDAPTVLTSNHSLENLAAIYDDRTASRVADGTIVAVNGKDRRVER